MAYQATARLDGRWWFVEVPELDTAGQARNLAEAEEVAREVIGLVLDVDPSTVAVDLEVQLPAETTELLAAAERDERAGRDAIWRAGRIRRDAIRGLVSSGASQVDVSRALHLSPQRVSQILHSHQKTTHTVRGASAATTR